MVDFDPTTMVDPAGSHSSAEISARCLAPGARAVASPRSDSTNATEPWQQSAGSTGGITIAKAQSNRTRRVENCIDRPSFLHGAAMVLRPVTRPTCLAHGRTLFAPYPYHIHPIYAFGWVPGKPGRLAGCPGECQNCIGAVIAIKIRTLRSSRRRRRSDWPAGLTDPRPLTSGSKERARLRSSPTATTEIEKEGARREHRWQAA